ncbi:MAG: HD domain-containing protein [Acidobacteriota bacterium]|nr:HD domain-containing protein [Acidobacteriota bacterium]
MNESAVTPTIEQTLISLARSVDEFEGYINPHASRIAGLSDAIAAKFKLSSHDRQNLKQAALLHDLGELVMNRDYIGAGRTMTGQERMDMKRHPVIGEQESAKRGYSRAVQLLIRWHHEWWNGGGYPDCLKRDAIPLGARILRVCDTYAALTDARPYSLPVSSPEAKRYLTEWAGIEFDPYVVKAFLSLTGLAELESLGDHAE